MLCMRCYRREMRAAGAWKWPGARESRKFCPSIARTFLSSTWLIADDRWSGKFRNSPALILTEMLFWNEKDSVRYGDFPDQSLNRFVLKIIANYTRHQNTLRHHWTGLQREPLKPWTPYQQFASYASRSGINRSFGVLYAAAYFLSYKRHLHIFKHRRIRDPPLVIGC